MSEPFPECEHGEPASWDVWPRYIAEGRFELVPMPESNPPSCPSCDTSAPWISIERPVEQETPSGPITIKTEVTECQNCGFQILTDSQLAPFALNSPKLNSSPPTGQEREL
jgi:hypothetical protein